ncbi:peptidoglycan-binding protein [Ornithinibacillus massiliensis]|uniref:Peptidoglycan-binding protein n=1 Tax=Ornithinibacillus massiliensis TaxID=1944633 RepID=A0ABS5MAI7_9BACI|nr:peptidoglycan-binding protein [Ornithinibacillus massiliensis]MBS3679313.1 peptidoglycan-binding protein [Ornithinibacillus massiliensis]
MRITRSTIAILFLITYFFTYSPQIFASELKVDSSNMEVGNVAQEPLDEELDVELSTVDIEFQENEEILETGTNKDATSDEVESVGDEELDTEVNDKSHENTKQETTTDSLIEESSNKDLLSNTEEEKIPGLYLKKGMFHESVIELKKDLEKLGFIKWKSQPNDYFGPSTEEALINLQNYYGLEPSGQTDIETLNKISEILSLPYQNGKRDKSIITLKVNLGILGYVKWKNQPTDFYGKQTENAIMAFQSDNNLPSSGIADPRTILKLEELANAPLKRGMYRQDVIDLKKKLEKLGFVKWKNEPNDFFGSSTDSVLKDFQQYYDVRVTGIADEETLKLVEQILSSPLQEGRSSKDAIKLKKDLETLGYVQWKNSPNEYYGASTKEAVKKFQKSYSLPESGIADAKTLNKIAAILKTTNSIGNRHKDNIQLKKDLELLGFVSWKNPPNDYFGVSTEQAVKSFQKHYGLAVNGIADKFTLDKIEEIKNSSLRIGQRHKDVIQLKKNLEILGYVKWKNSPNNYYGKETAWAVKKFQKENNLPTSGIVDEITLTIYKKATKSIVKIFLDPGHGGKDSGGVGIGLKEKDVVLDIALKTSSYLTNGYLGVDVKLSRTTDQFIELVDRSQIANSWGADYFVSLHTNALNGTAEGFETYIYNGKISKEEKDRQADIHNYILKRIEVKDRGMKQANFSVLRNTNMPAILIEYMFIDNAVENRLLKSASYRDYLAKITADAIANSYGLKRR